MVCYLCSSFFTAEFQDVNVIVILGFGFLGTFLVRYGFSASGFNLLVAVIATQWAIILHGIESFYCRGTAKINLKRWVFNGGSRTASLLISWPHVQKKAPNLKMYGAYICFIIA